MTFKTLTINSQEFAREPQTLKGTLATNELPRLVEFGGNLQYQLQSNKPNQGLSADSHPAVQLLIQAQLSLPCQRCLENMPLTLDLRFDYIVSAQMPENLEGADDTDWIEASQTFDLAALIEDEVLAALPIAPTHQAGCVALKTESGERLNAFEMLKNLKLNLKLK